MRCRIISGGAFLLIAHNPRFRVLLRTVEERMMAFSRQIGDKNRFPIPHFPASYRDTLHFGVGGRERFKQRSAGKEIYVSIPVTGPNDASFSANHPFPLPNSMI